MKNMYESESMAEFLGEEDWNPNFDKHNLKINWNYLVLGPTGSGKTNFLMNLIEQFHDTFEEITIYTSQPNEKLYQCIKKKIENYEGSSITTLDKIISVTDLDEEKQKLIVFDDWITLPDREKVIIEKYSTEARKKLCTTVYITQHYYKVPDTIRGNYQYLIFLKLTNMKNLRMIMNTLPVDLEPEELRDIVKEATKNKFDVCIMDLITNDDNKVIRKGFDEYLVMDNFKN